MQPERLFRFFQALLALDLTVREETATELFSNVMQLLNRSLRWLRSVFLIEEVRASLTAAAGFYALTLLGRWMNGLTLIVWVWVLVFSVPKVSKAFVKIIYLG